MVTECTSESLERIQRFIKVDRSNNDLVSKIDTPKNMMQVFEYIQNNPIFTIKAASDHVGLSYNTVSKCVKVLMEKGIVGQLNEQTRYREFEYLGLIECLK